MKPRVYEINFDGIVGPTHNYAGLSWGNIASQRWAHEPSSPKGAALEGLAKMRQLVEMGLKQAVLPPHDRPAIDALRRLGFSGRDSQVVERAHRERPALLAACYSASSMWAANAATVSPSSDTADGRLHFTPANLTSQFHRSLETNTTYALLTRIFADESLFAVHRPLSAGLAMTDEGAANHTRLCTESGQPGIEIFVYGRHGLGSAAAHPARFPARQTREASEAVARLHRLDPASVLFVQQAPAAIDAGVFHNDVIAVGNANVLLYHERAFSDGEGIDLIRRAFASVGRGSLTLIEVTEHEVSLSDAINSYLFNSQLVSLPDGSMALIHPRESLKIASARRAIDRIIAGDNPIAAAHMVDVRQSMRNGGGPACLRLRVVMTETQMNQAHTGVFMNEQLLERLSGWIVRHYRDELAPDDLADPNLVDESRAALDQLTQILGLGSIYGFQRDHG